MRPRGPVLAAMSAPTGPLTVEPTVPRPDVAPCVVELFNETALTGFDSFSYTPPPACPPPWAKVVFEMDMASVTRTGSVANLRVGLSHPDDGDFVLFMGAPQIHSGLNRWRVERDLTDYASLLAQPELPGLIEHTWDNSSPSVDEDVVTGSARIKFYPPTVAQPAPSVPDVMFTHAHAYRMPRNIVRAYVEVLAQGLDEIGTSDRLWYTCTPDFYLEIHPGLNNPFTIGDDWGATLSSSPMGCNSPSHREVEVLLDGVVVGTAPIFPWLPSNLHRRFADSVDKPVPSAQALNFIPYRVDVTPIASLLNDGALHTLSLRVAGDYSASATHFQVDGKLLAWVDPDRAIVTGAVTRNTYAPPPTVGPTGGFCAQDIDTVTCNIENVVKQRYTIDGYVNTSAGRVYSTVDTRYDFKNVQRIFADGIFHPNHRGYKQALDMDSRVHTTSERRLGGVTLARDVVDVRYPLKLVYVSAGRMVDNGEGGYIAQIDSIAAQVDQAREQKIDLRRGAERYTSQLRDAFSGEHRRNNVTGTDPVWQSQREYAFRDSLGDCFAARRTTVAGALATASTGVGCPGGINRMSWFVRPDGSPENMGWVP